MRKEAKWLAQESRPLETWVLNVERVMNQHDLGPGKDQVDCRVGPLFLQRVMNQRDLGVSQANIKSIAGSVLLFL